MTNNFYALCLVGLLCFFGVATAKPIDLVEADQVMPILEKLRIKAVKNETLSEGDLLYMDNILRGGSPYTVAHVSWIIEIAGESAASLKDSLDVSRHRGLGFADAQLALAQYAIDSVGMPSEKRVNGLLVLSQTADNYLKLEIAKRLLLTSDYRDDGKSLVGQIDTSNSPILRYQLMQVVADYDLDSGIAGIAEYAPVTDNSYFSFNDDISSSGGIRFSSILDGVTLYSRDRIWEKNEDHEGENGAPLEPKTVAVSKRIALDDGGAVGPINKDDALSDDSYIYIVMVVLLSVIVIVILVLRKNR